MRAARIHEYGPPEVLQIDEVPPPSPGKGEVLVDIHATSVNPVDYKIRSGGQRGAIWLKLPAILGMDLSGVVSAVGAGVTRFKPGDAVFGSPSHRRMGTYAEQLAVRADELATKPARLTHEQAAALPLVGLTAWDALVTSARLQPGERVLIQAGSGGVGSVAIQLAKHLGARVLTTCSPRNTALVADLGADEIIDYRSTDWAEAARDVDVILESIGAADLTKAISTVRRGGRIAAITARLPDYTARYGPALGLAAVGCTLAGRITKARLTRGVKLAMVTRRPSGQNLDSLAALVDEGALRPVIDQTFPLAQIAEAHRYLETGRARGKVIVATR